LGRAHNPCAARASASRALKRSGAPAQPRPSSSGHLRAGERVPSRIRCGHGDLRPAEAPIMEVARPRRLARLRTSEEISSLILRKENSAWGYTRIQGALKKLGTAWPGVRSLAAERGVGHTTLARAVLEGWLHAAPSPGHRARFPGRSPAPRTPGPRAGPSGPALDIALGRGSEFLSNS
jgi:hypothetical protein